MEVDLRIGNPAHTLQRIRAMESPPAHTNVATTAENTPNPLLVSVNYYTFSLNIFHLLMCFQCTLIKVNVH